MVDVSKRLAEIENFSDGVSLVVAVFRKQTETQKNKRTRKIREPKMEKEMQRDVKGRRKKRNAIEDTTEGPVDRASFVLNYLVIARR